MSAWTQFVTDNYHLVKHLPNKERLKALSEMYKQGKTKGGGLTASSERKRVEKRNAQREAEMRVVNENREFIRKRDIEANKQAVIRGKKMLEEMKSRN
jgi:aryl-alcohol dehydrogenase-like predicted oxidoreductase